MYGRRVHGRELTFAFEPLLYQHNLVLTDLQTNSRWSQLGHKSIQGTLQDEPLAVVASIQTTWKHWRKMHPDTLVVAVTEPQGSTFMYRHPEPAGDGQWGTVDAGSPEALDRFELVLGIQSSGSVKAYPFSQLACLPQPVTDRVGDRRVTVHFHAAAPAAWATDSAGNVLPTVTTYWRAWNLFHPHSDVYVATRSR